jgi:Kef-type K+ transport system membrane component KefB
MTNLMSIAGALLIVFLGAEIATHFRMPRTIGQLLAALILAIPWLHRVIFTPDALPVFSTLGDLGMILLLLLTGLTLNIKQFKSVGRDAVLIGTSAAAVSFLFGFGLGLFILNIGFNASLVLGASLSVTAEGMTILFLTDLKKINTPVASAIIGGGVVDDIFEAVFLTMVIILTHQAKSLGNLSLLPFKIIGFALLVYIATLLIPKLIHPVEKEHTDSSLFSLTIIISLVAAIGAQWAGLGAMVGALIAGVIMQKSFLSHYDELKEKHILETFVFGFLIGFFFIHIGYSFDFTVFRTSPVLVIVVMLAALSGKILGTMIMKPFTRFSWKQMYLIGWAMNSRGVLELVLIQIALTNNLITKELYSAIVFMALSTTLIFPFVLKALIKRNPGIMD